MTFRVLSFACAAFTWGIAGCSSKGEPASPSANVPAVTPEAPPPPVAVRRTVESRNPFGNTAVTDNLMADGDFELTGRYDQQPWLAFGSDGQGQSVLNFETGGRCKSGIRCLVLTPGETVIGWMATPRSGQVTVSLWARPQGGTCKDLSVQVVDLDESSTSTKLDPPAAPDESGACRFEGVAPSFPGGSPAVYLEVAPKSKVTNVVVDDVVALLVPPDAKQTRQMDPARVSAPAKVKAIAEWLRRHRRFGLPNEVGVERPAKTLRDRQRER